MRKIALLVYHELTLVRIRGGALVISMTVKIIELNKGILKIRGVEKLPLPTGLVLTYPVADFNFASWMSSDQLRILRAEQSSSNNIPGMREFAEHKDHLHRVSPLSMVPDRKPRKSMKRRSSWKDTLRGFTSGGEDRALSPVRKLPRSLTDDGSLADAEGDDEEYAGYKEEDKPIEARVKYRYENLKPKDQFLRTHSALERKQDEMAAALREADNKAIQAFGGKEKRTVPIGTRLTMSSRAGYFQDRIISPSMVRRVLPDRRALAKFVIDASHGHPVYRSPPESRLCDGLPYISDFNTGAYFGTIPTADDSVR